MTPEHVQQVQSTWAKIAPASHAAAGLFYGRLFELYPETATLYGTDRAEQGPRFMEMMELAVNALSDPARAIPKIEEMGARHAGYGVIDADYDKVSEAFLWTLGEVLVEDFTPEVEAAWTSFFDALAATMKAGAAREKRIDLASGAPHPASAKRPEAPRRGMALPRPQLAPDPRNGLGARAA